MLGTPHQSTMSRSNAAGFHFFSKADTDDDVTRYWLGWKLAKSENQAEILHYVVTRWLNSFLCFPPFIYHFPWEKVLNWCIKQSQDAQVSQILLRNWPSQRIVTCDRHSGLVRLFSVVDDSKTTTRKVTTPFSKLKNLTMIVFVKQICIGAMGHAYTFTVKFLIPS